MVGVQKGWLSPENLKYIGSVLTTSEKKSNKILDYNSINVERTLVVLEERIEKLNKEVISTNETLKKLIELIKVNNNEKEKESTKTEE